jgi:hypothetical protein
MSTWIRCTLVACAVLSAFTARAQNGTQFHSWLTPADEPRRHPTRGCSDMAHASSREIAIVSAIVAPPTEALPRFCRVIGNIRPTVLFEIDLPDEWNGRLYMFGNGAFAGEAFDRGDMVEARDKALAHGFVVVFTNTGHDAKTEPLARFAGDQQKLVDFAYRAIHATVRAAGSMLQTYYRRAADHMYFDGCSTGGRQGLIEAQRYPDDFDGILVGAPMLDYVGTMISTAWIERALDAGRITSSKLPLIAQHAYERCDAVDGLADGIIDDPRRCDFSPQRDVPSCAAGTDNANCLTPLQSTALARIYADVTSRGLRIFPGWPIGSEATGDNPFTDAPAPGWVPIMINDSGPSLARIITEAFFQDIAFPAHKPRYQLSDFDFDRDPPRLDALRKLFDSTNPDLTRFRARRGKLLMYAGWADPALNPKMAVNYYEAVAARMDSQTPEFFRLFMVPGMFHCSGGVGPSQFDAMTPLIRWVESGVAPESIEASQLQHERVVRTRPLCPYPRIARLKEGGDPSIARDFTCEPPHNL